MTALVKTQYLDPILLECPLTANTSFVFLSSRIGGDFVRLRKLLLISGRGGALALCGDKMEISAA